MSNEKLAAAFVAGAILMAVALVAVGAPLGDAGDEDYVRVTADASAAAEPDAASVTLAVEARDRDPGAARQQVAHDVSSMRQALRDLGIPDDDVRTTGFTVREDRQPRDEGEERLHLARHSFEVPLNDTEGVGQVIDGALDAGATSVSNVRFTLSEDRRDELKATALSHAMDRARSQADAAAEAGGISAGEVRSIYTADTGFSPVRMDRVAYEAEDAGTVVEPGDVEVDASVEVVYERR